MDSLTQIVLGAAVSEHFIGKKIGNRALLYGGIIGTIPDLDVFVGNYYDILTANEIHRGFSHSLVFFILATPILAWFLKWLERKQGVTWPQAAYTAFWCLCTHAMLDAFTNWGTQLFWPLESRIAIQSIFVIDPLYTLPFIFCLVRVMMLNRADDRRRQWNNRGLIISSSYLALTLILQFTARMQFTDMLEQSNTVYQDISVRPAPLSAILWNANVQTEEGYLLGEYSFFDSSPISYQYFSKDEFLLGKHINDPVVQRLKKVSEGWYIITSQDGHIYFNDLRFGLMNEDPNNPEFVFRYLLDTSDGQVRAKEAHSPSRDDPKKLIKRLWTRIKGN